MIGEKRILLGVAIGAIIVYLLLKPKKTAPTAPIQVSESELSKTTKDCVLDYYDCSKSRYETIQIPMDADCNTFQPAKPQCMKRMDIDLTAPLLTEL